MSLESLLPSLMPEDRRILLNVLLALGLDASAEGKERILDTVLAFRSVDAETLKAIVHEVEQTYCLGCGDLRGACEVRDCDEGDEEGELPEMPSLDAELESRSFEGLAALSAVDRRYVFDNLEPMREEEKREIREEAFDLATHLMGMTDEDRLTLLAKFVAVYCRSCGIDLEEGTTVCNVCEDEEQSA